MLCGWYCQVNIEFYRVEAFRHGSFINHFSSDRNHQSVSSRKCSRRCPDGGSSVNIEIAANGDSCSHDESDRENEDILDHIFSER